VPARFAVATSSFRVKTELFHHLTLLLQISLFPFDFQGRQVLLFSNSLLIWVVLSLGLCSFLFLLLVQQICCLACIFPCPCCCRCPAFVRAHRILIVAQIFQVSRSAQALQFFSSAETSFAQAIAPRFSLFLFAVLFRQQHSRPACNCLSFSCRKRLRC
jgi:hypothetical protein